MLYQVFLILIYLFPWSSTFFALANVCLPVIILTKLPPLLSGILNLVVKLVKLTKLLPLLSGIFNLVVKLVTLTKLLPLLSTLFNLPVKLAILSIKLAILLVTRTVDVMMEDSGNSVTVVVAILPFVLLYAAIRFENSERLDGEKVVTGHAPGLREDHYLREEVEKVVTDAEEMDLFPGWDGIMKIY